LAVGIFFQSPPPGGLFHFANGCASFVLKLFEELLSKPEYIG